jgi:hypothetical protein
VVLTLWADQATRSELDGCEGQLLQVGAQSSTVFFGMICSQCFRRCLLQYEL